MGLWCSCCTFLKWSGSETCANQGRSRWAAAPANESNSTPTVTIPKLQWTLAMLLHWVGNYIQYMILYVSLVIGAGFLLLCMTLIGSPWNAEIQTPSFRRHHCKQFQSLKHLSKRHINHIHHFQYWLSLNIIDLSWPTSIIAFHIFPHFSTFSSVFIRFPSPALQTCPSCPRGQAWLWAPCWAVSHSRVTGVTSGDKMGQNVISINIKQVSNISKFTKVQVIQVIRKGCCMAASVQCIKSGVWLYWIPRNVICLLL